jgi:MFS family permease
MNNVQVVRLPPFHEETYVRLMKSSTAALAALSLSMLLASLGTSIPNVALPALAETFGAPMRQVQWIVLAYLLAITSVIVSAGRLGDLAGRRRLLLGGIALFTAASIGCALAPTLAALILARALQGVGAAAMMALAMPLVADAVPQEKRGRAIGLLGTTSAIGTAVGPSLGGLLITAFGWRALFIVLVPLAFMTGFLALRSLPADSSRQTAGERFDGVGTFLLAMTLAAYALAMTEGRRSLLIAALFLAALFVRVEARQASPLIHLEMFGDRVRNAALLANALVTTVVMATLVVGPFYLSGALALDSASVGMILSTGPLVAALTGIPAGRAVDRFGGRRLTMLSLSIMTIGCVGFSLSSGRFGVLGYVVPLITITAGYALFQTANNTAVIGEVRPEQRGVVSGMLNLSRNLGLITGASFMGAIFAAAGSGEPGLRATFGVGAMLVILALVAVAVAPITAERWRARAAAELVRPNS